MEQNEVEFQFQKFNNSMGRKALKHNIKKVLTARPSIQGKWTPTTFAEFPQHYMEMKKPIVGHPIIPFPQNEIKDKKVRTHPLTNYQRKKFPLFK